MAIRFNCPSCGQPIEIDDDWSEQSVGCPYCKQVVNTPKSSTWPSGQVLPASPARSAFDAPLPPASGQYGGVTVPTGSSSAGWALLLAILCALLSCVSLITWSAVIYQAVVERVGTDASDEVIKKSMEKMILDGSVPTHPVVAACALIGALCGIGGLFLAIRSLLRKEPRQG